MKIVVTGASGLLGANFSIHAQQSGHDVLALYHRHRIQLPYTYCRQIDLSDREQIDAMIETIRPDWIVHAAALTDVDWCEENRQAVQQVNVEATRHLANVCKNVGTRLLCVSSDSVFSGSVGNYSENDKPEPVNVYARSKYQGEIIVTDILQKHSLIVRTNFYGWSPAHKSSLSEWVLQRLQSGQGVPGFQDIRISPILTNHLSRTILEMIAKDLKGVFHVSGSTPVSKYDFALEIARTFGVRTDLVTPVSIDDHQLHAPRPKDTTLNIEKISGILRQGMPDLASGLQSFRLLGLSGYSDRLKSFSGVNEYVGITNR